MTTRIAEPPRSKHALIAAALSTDIQAGKYKIGDLLPSEAELAISHGVSRHTVRIALQSLHHLGLVVSHQGVGTKVHKNRLTSRYQHSFNSVADLLQYASSTKPKLIDSEEFKVTAAQAEQFGCKPGERWWRMRTLRFPPSGTTPMAYTEIHIPLALSAVIADAVKGKQPVFALIEKRFHLTPIEVRQDIAATSLTREEAELLGVPRNGPGLEIIRRYIGKGERVLEVARSVHPGKSFKYSMHVQLQNSG